MILVDTEIWVDHFRRMDPGLTEALERGQVLGHPWVAGELALGGLANRPEVLRLLHQLPQAVVATSAELQDFIVQHGVSGLGIGYVDLQLLASTLLSDGARLWTRDRRLAKAAVTLGRSYSAST